MRVNFVDSRLVYTLPILTSELSLYDTTCLRYSFPRITIPGAASICLRWFWKSSILVTTNEFIVRAIFCVVIFFRTKAYLPFIYLVNIFGCIVVTVELLRPQFSLYFVCFFSYYLFIERKKVNQNTKYRSSIVCCTIFIIMWTRPISAVRRNLLIIACGNDCSAFNLSVCIYDGGDGGLWHSCADRLQFFGC